MNTPIIDQRRSDDDDSDGRCRWPYYVGFAFKEETIREGSVVRYTSPVSDAFDEAFNHDPDAAGEWINAQLVRQDKRCWATGERFKTEYYHNGLDRPYVYRIEVTGPPAPAQFVIVRQRVAVLMDEHGVAYFDHCRLGVPGYPDVQAYLYLGRGFSSDTGVRYRLFDESSRLDGSLRIRPRTWHAKVRRNVSPLERRVRREGAQSSGTGERTVAGCARLEGQSLLR